VDIPGLLGTDIWVFLGLTVILFGGAAFMMGQALAVTWRPVRHVVAYGLLLAAGARFLSYALFGADLLSPGGYVASAVVLIVVALLAFRLARVQSMVTQYPWLYEREGAFNWREKRAHG
jgi:hypothetical protein